MEIDRQGNVVRHEMHDGVIHSDARMTYTDVSAILLDRDPELLKKYKDFVPMFETMHELFEILNQRRRRRGSIDFDLKEPAIILDDEGMVQQIVAAERRVANRIIEEFMLVANETVAQHLDDNNVPTLYRIHESPDPLKVEQFEEFVSTLGYSLGAPPNAVQPRHFQKLVEKIHGKPEEKPIAFLMLRTMQKARYEENNSGHFGLAASSYTHFTSPIRRYPDLVVHRSLRESRGKMSKERVEELTEDLPEMGRHTSERERRAAEAERELVQWKKVRFMADKVGDEFDGYVTGVTAFGLFIELVEHFVEGMVHVSTMADDYYRFIERAHVLRGENTGTVYRLGDKVRVQVIKVDMERRQIDLGLVGILDRVRASESNRGPRRSKADPKAERHLKAGRRKQRPGKRERKRRNADRKTAESCHMRCTSIVIGTAGHIDHGKSALVKALTGTDPDRLKEEKARGITIDLGFAHAAVGAFDLAFVDVPGHERFVKNMLAGVGGIDAVLLVIAADESVMPQTREHFAICRLLQIPRRTHRAHQIRSRRRRHAGAGAARRARAGRRIGAGRRADRRRLGEDRRRARRAARRRSRRSRRAPPSARTTARRGCPSIACSRCAGSGRWSPAR